MKRIAIIDASITLKWVIEEEGSAVAMQLTRQHSLRAPDVI